MKFEVPIINKLLDELLPFRSKRIAFCVDAKNESIAIKHEEVRHLLPFLVVEKNKYQHFVVNEKIVLVNDTLLGE